MRIEWGVICGGMQENPSVESIHLLSVSDRVFCHSFPSKPTVRVVAKLHFTLAETEHPVDLTILVLSRNKVIWQHPIRYYCNDKKLCQTLYDYREIDLIGVPLEQEGPYSIDFSVAGDRLHRIDFQACKATIPPPP
jgi:hypothetical protein